jgi:hypothetical protein
LEYKTILFWFLKCTLFGCLTYQDNKRLQRFLLFSDVTTKTNQVYVDKIMLPHENYNVSSIKIQTTHNLLSLDNIIVWAPSILHFKGLGTTNLLYEMRICQKSYNKVTKTVYVWFKFLWIRRLILVCQIQSGLRPSQNLWTLQIAVVVIG